MTLHPLDVVVLTHDLPVHGLRCGDLAAVVDVYAPDAIAVEFVAAISSTTDQRTRVKEGTLQQSRLVGVGLACFVVGALVQAGLAQTKKPTFSPELFKGKEAKEAATALLDGALQLAEAGSWERIAVGRAWYLGGDKAKGQEIFDFVTGGKKVEDGDWFRVGRVYAEAGEWDKAQAAFDRALAMNADDDSGMIEYGALANVNNDRAKAEALFEKAMKKKPREFWHWVSAGASYLGVRPQ